MLCSSGKRAFVMQRQALVIRLPLPTSVATRPYVYESTWLVQRRLLSCLVVEDRRASWLCSGFQHEAICSNTSVYVGVTIFALVRSCRRVDRLETTRFLSATGVGLLIAVASATFVCAHKGLAGFGLESNMTAYCSNTTAHIGVTIFALCWGFMWSLRERHRFSTRPLVLHFIYDCYLQHWTHQSSSTRFGRKFVVHFCVVRTDIFSTPPKRCV